jgi:hypothetical protein
MEQQHLHDPLRNQNRQAQTKSVTGDIRPSVTLYDIDSAIISYLELVVLPTLEMDGHAVKIPVVYGNSERWNAVRKEGIYRDEKGRINLPMVMIRRSTVAKNDAMPVLNRHVSYTSVTKWSKTNKYDRMVALNPGLKPKVDIYKITIPDYVEITYECIAWTNYIDQLNEIVESLTFASDEYWGDKNKFKFITTVDNYNITNELEKGNERVNRVEFSLNVKAYLLPEKFYGSTTTQKARNAAKIVTGEIDGTGGRIEQALITPSSYYDNKDLIDFLNLNNTKSGLPLSVNTITFTAVKLVAIPTLLTSSVTPTMTSAGINYDVRVYINGVRYLQSNNFTVTYSQNSFTLTIDFNPTNLGFSVGLSDEVAIIGRFIEL